MTKAKPITGPGWHKRMRVHRHNGFSGCARMMQAQLRNIIEADSTCGVTKVIAQQMYDQIPDLLASLKTRIDP